jgi:hypothetical protein
MLNSPSPSRRTDCTFPTSLQPPMDIRGHFFPSRLIHYSVSVVVIFPVIGVAIFSGNLARNGRRRKAVASGTDNQHRTGDLFFIHSGCMVRVEEPESHFRPSASGIMDQLFVISFLLSFNEIAYQVTTKTAHSSARSSRNTPASFHGNTGTNSAGPDSCGMAVLCAFKTVYRCVDSD